VDPVVLYYRPEGDLAPFHVPFGGTEMTDGVFLHSGHLEKERNRGVSGRS